MLARFIPEPLRSLLAAARMRANSDRIHGHARGLDGESCLLIMNGPSLRQSEHWLESRKTDAVIAVNHFADSEWFERLRPEIYIMQDRYFWHPDVAETYKEKRERTFAELRGKTNWPIRIFLPAACNRKTWVAGQLDNPNIELAFWNSASICKRHNDGAMLESTRWLFRLWQKEWAAPPPDNVLVAALYLAERLEFSSLTVIGADFSFFQEMQVDQQTNQVGRQVGHFYGEEFRPISKGKTGERPTTMAHEMLRWHRAFRSLEVMADYLRQQDVQVVNRSAHSFIDCFARA